MKRIIVLTFAALLQVIGLSVFSSVAWDLSRLPQIGDLRKRNPATTALMAQRAAEARAKGKQFRPVQLFVPYGSISPHLKRAVLIAEDAGFFLHSGVDYEELTEAFKADWKKKRWARGASTITMQLAKNLYLSNRKTLARKFSEFIIARRMDEELSKTRILELYFNYIEWGDGTFGCQAASRLYFNASALDLTPEQAIRLAAIIVNPRRYNPFSDTKRMQNRRRWIAERMLAAKFLTPEQRQTLPF
ncbi:MAG: monofunctional biosynthetic peptidoglycan transglycosylase [Candidatus Edwardsbacteria bacterium]|nr:monofunctional biosynthetic peptidoglycan transglycosylase [Candidatus Edwardsbacteria bacterium]